ncbi:MAG: hypothetical protein DHS20C01_14040 [marine bacterium B5-7]|nr:MAG: hypothetical protein DHS20C01_14040 [marine bacterium B5-7]
MSKGRFDELSKTRDFVRRFMKEQWKLKIVSNKQYADVEWNIQTAWNHIHEADACLIISDANDKSLVKSSNRVTQAMALGLPVLASPLDSYKQIIRESGAGFIFDNGDELLAGLNKLTRETKRQEMASNAYSYATQNYSIDVIGRKWHQLIFDDVSRNKGHVIKQQVHECKLLARVYSRLSLSEAPNMTISYRLNYALKGMKSNPLDYLVWVSLLKAGCKLILKGWRHLLSAI